MGATPLRQLPSVARVLQRLEAEGALADYPRALVVACARDVVDRAREGLRAGGPTAAPVSVEALAADAQALLAERAPLSLARAVNATGVIVHTNLGRAP
ncbi:MAG TPA: L-seryl-tRNA(Sec) selenium transferase, partial [bacterium]|nr:L-seryl-tRNA(Sec) selenium transferase [bacterium]